MRFLLMALFIPLAIGNCFAQSKLDASLQNIFADRYQGEQSGAAMLVFKDGKLLFERYRGLANVEHAIPVIDKTRFPIGSITKQFTATAILLLQEQGLLSTSDYIGKYLSDFAIAEYPVTIKHLLTHCSGIPSDNKTKDLSRNLHRLTPSGMLDIIKREALLFDPGTQYDYSNNGYMLLGLIIEKLSGTSYGAFLAQHIFSPNEMYHTQVGGYQDIIKHRAAGYTTNDENELVNASYHTSSFSAGGMISTPSDLNRWTSALFSGKILSRNSLTEMLQNYQLVDGTSLNLGYGWEINDISGTPSYEHSGFEPGYKCYSIYIPKENIYVITMQNNESGTPSTLSIQAAGMAIGKPYPSKENVSAVRNINLDRFVGVYAFAEGKQRIIGLEDGKLYYKAPGGLKNALNLLNDSTLIFAEGYRQLTFKSITDMGFKNIVYVNRRYSENGFKTSVDIPHEKKPLELASEVLQNYVGVYESPQFSMTISLEGDLLFAQPQGSDKLQLIPLGGHKFFIEEIGAEITFIRENIKDKAFHYIDILLEGNKMRGIRK